MSGVAVLPCALGPPGFPVLRFASRRVLVRACPAFVGRCCSRPPCGRPLRVRRVVSRVASAACVSMCSGRSTSKAPPAGRLGEQGGHGHPAVWSVLGFRWWWGAVVVLSSPGTGGNQEPAEGASGDGFVRLKHDFALAACPLDRTPVGLRLPGEESTTTSRGNLALALCPSPAAELRMRNTASGDAVRFRVCSGCSVLRQDFTSGPAGVGYLFDQRLARPSGSRV